MHTTLYLFFSFSLALSVSHCLPFSFFPDGTLKPQINSVNIRNLSDLLFSPKQISNRLSNAKSIRSTFAGDVGH